MSLEVYYHDIVVTADHIDNLNHVNNVTYLQWVQDAAYAHWISKAPKSIQEQFNWVVLRHEIEYKHPAFLGEELTAKTWVHDYSGVKSTRVVQILRRRDNKLLVEARSLWCLINAATNRPARIGAEITDIFLDEQTSRSRS